MLDREHCALCLVDSELSVDYCGDCSGVRGVLCTPCLDGLTNRANRRQYVLRHAAVCLDPTVARLYDAGAASAPENRLRAQLGYATWGVRAASRYDPVALTGEELKFIKWLLKHHGRWPRVGEPGHRSHRGAPNYYLHASGEVPDPGGHRAAIRKLMAREQAQSPTAVEPISSGKPHPDPLKPGADPAIIRTFPDPDPRPYGLNSPGWGGGYDVETRPAAPKDDADRPASAADRLLDDAYERNGRQAVPVSELRELAYERGVSWATVARAGAVQGIVPHKPKGSKGKWFWHWPGRP